MTKFKSTYKPLLFTTTMRNPERLKNFLSVLKEFNSEILNDEIIHKVVKKLIKSGLYQTVYEMRDKDFMNTVKQGLELSTEQVEDIIANSPQDHKEAGFEKGWPSRFATWYGFAKELGFVYYEMGERIMFSEVGLRLVDNEHPEFEQQVFLNAFAKYQRNNPFRRISNENVPLLLLLKVIKRLNDDPDYKGTGISRREIPLILCWRDSDSDALYLKIKEIRKKYRYEPSDETILEICDELTFGRQRSHKDETIIREYPDDFIRKMKLTGLITIRGFGRFIDINYNEIGKVFYLIKEYSKYKKYKTEKEYFEYMATIDKKLISIRVTRKFNTAKQIQLLLKWANHYTWENIKKEMLNLAENKRSNDAVLKLISGPMRLEFLTAMAIISKHPKIKLKPNYISDDEGLPSSHAPGNRADIECDESGNYILVEVTLLTGTQQNIREMPSITRHLKTIRLLNKNSISFFVSPRTHEDSTLFSAFIKSRDNLDIMTMSISELLKDLESKTALYSTKHIERKNTSHF